MYCCGVNTSGQQVEELAITETSDTGTLHAGDLKIHSCTVGRPPGKQKDKFYVLFGSWTYYLFQFLEESQNIDQRKFILLAYNISVIAGDNKRCTTKNYRKNITISNTIDIQPLKKKKKKKKQIESGNHFQLFPNSSLLSVSSLRKPTLNWFP